ncbi:MAG: ATP-binding cassette domain-containing protein [Acidimicrobiia bacterium]|nr:ATP-binding cassette domain-containing protein [Acidimicrobiia bacterium]
MLEVANISKRFGDVVALRDVSFEVRPGRIMGFLGRNGAGKTTTMRTVFGLVAPDSGSVTYDGAVVDHDVRLAFGYMPEERGLYPRMRVRDQLVYFGRLAGLSKGDAGTSADRWLDAFGLADRSHSKLEDLSHGNQQRVQLAAAIVADPEVLVLDEPFSGLDPIGVESLSEVLRGFAAGGTAILFSSHQLDLVEDVCEDVTIIDQGEIVVQGDLEHIRERAPYRRVEIWVDGRLWEPPVADVRTVEASGRAHHIVAADVDVDEMLSMAQASGSITRFSYEPPSLSDIFQEAVLR